MTDRIVECLYAAIDTINRERSGDLPLPKSLDTRLYGSASALDSLGLVNFIVAVEVEIEKTFGTVLVLADDRALSREPSPFASVESLASYIEMLLGEME